MNAYDIRPGRPDSRTEPGHGNRVLDGEDRASDTRTHMADGSNVSLGATERYGTKQAEELQSVQDGKAHEDRADGQTSEDPRFGNRTTGREENSCRRCGEAIKGRRRNDYCSDRCRMKDRRERDRGRVDELLQRIENDFDALREALVGEVDS